MKWVLFPIIFVLAFINAMIEDLLLWYERRYGK